MKPSSESACAKTVRVSPKFQVVIPKNLRDELKLKPGEELQIYVLDGSIRLHRIRPITDLRGIAKGLRWKDGYREDRDASSKDRTSED